MQVLRTPRRRECDAQTRASRSWATASRTTTMSSLRCGEAWHSACPLSFTASRTTSLSACSSGDAHCSAWRSHCTAASTTSRSAHSFGAAHSSAAPHWRASRTKHLSALSAGEAHSRAAPFCFGNSSLVISSAIEPIAAIQVQS